jgi:hypothetical protein
MKTLLACMLLLGLVASKPTLEEFVADIG